MKYILIPFWQVVVLAATAVAFFITTVHIYREFTPLMKRREKCAIIAMIILIFLAMRGGTRPLIDC